MNRLINLFLVITLVMLTGCMPTEAKRDPAYAAVRPIATAIPETNDGAIYQAGNTISLFEDYRARRVGDILTINLEEKTAAEKETATTISKSNNNSVTNPTILGTTPEFSLPGFLPLANSSNNNLGLNMQSKSTFDGSGDSDQSNKLTGAISVSVVEVLPNGNLLVRGEKVITINQGNEYLRISGMISPRDLDANNSISSKRVADAQISYVGDGPTQDANVVGWLSRFFISSLMPF